MILRAAATLTVLTVIAGYAVFSYGGVLAQDWTVCLLAIGLLGLMSGLIPSGRGEHIPILERALWIPLILFPGYLALQTLPLPWFLLRAFSPARADLLRGLEPIFPPNGFASFSVMPPATFGQLLRVLAYSIVLLLVREAVWRLPDRPWSAAVPIIAIGGLEAALGLLQYSANPASALATGSYVNRNHFAGLLEMALPFAVMYTFVLIQRARAVGAVELLPAVRLCAVGASGVVMMLGILHSLSRMGFVAAVCSLLIMGLFQVRGGLAPRVTWTNSLAGAAAVIALLTFLPPNRLLARFAELSGGDGLSGNVRIQLWHDTVGLIAAYPIFGCGAGAYEYAFPMYKTVVPFFNADYAHNDYLQGFAELGLVGFVILLVFVLRIIVVSIRATAAEAPPESRALALACVGALAAIVIHSFSEFNLYIPANALLLAWIMGIAAGFEYSARLVPSVVSLGGHTVIDIKPGGRMTLRFAAAYGKFP